VFGQRGGKGRIFLVQFLREVGRRMKFLLFSDIRGFGGEGKMI